MGAGAFAFFIDAADGTNPSVARDGLCRFSMQNVLKMITLPIMTRAEAADQSRSYKLQWAREHGGMGEIAVH
jgi:hypothetical protein